MKTLYLHIGLHKTGTTALQCFFDSNDKVLRELGIYYPHEGRVGAAHHEFAREAISSVAPEIARQRIQTTARQMARSSGECQTVLVSSEVFSEENVQIESFASMGEVFNSIKCIIYLRRQDNMKQAVYNTAVTLGETYGTIREEELYYLDYYWHCKRWSDIFGKENIIVRIYENGQLIDSSIFSDFLGVFGLCLDSRLIIPRHLINPRTDPLALEFLRLANKSDWPGGPEGDLRTQFRDAVITLIRSDDRLQKAFSRFNLLSPQECLDLLTSFGDSNARVAREFLGRADGRLFLEPPPRSDEAAVAPLSLSPEVAVNIAVRLWIEAYQKASKEKEAGPRPEQSAPDGQTDTNSVRAPLKDAAVQHVAQKLPSVDRGSTVWDRVRRALAQLR